MVERPVFQKLLRLSPALGVTILPGGLFTAANVTLKLLISHALGVAEAHIEGGPGWVESEVYDVEARANTPVKMTPEELQPCLQAMLSERFGLKFHRETKQGQVYSLVVAKGGPKLTAHKGEGQMGFSGSSGGGEVEVRGTKAPMARLAGYLSAQAGRPVVDHTGLKGEYDFVLTWNADDANAGPSVFTALQEQLGLRLETAKGLIDVIVIDGATGLSVN